MVKYYNCDDRFVTGGTGQKQALDEDLELLRNGNNIPSRLIGINKDEKLKENYRYYPIISNFHLQIGGK